MMFIVTHQRAEAKIDEQSAGVHIASKCVESGFETS